MCKWKKLTPSHFETKALDTVPQASFTPSPSHNRENPAFTTILTDADFAWCNSTSDRIRTTGRKRTSPRSARRTPRNRLLRVLPPRPKGRRFARNDGCVHCPSRCNLIDGTSEDLQFGLIQLETLGNNQSKLAFIFMKAVCVLRRTKILCKQCRRQKNKK